MSAPSLVEANRHFVAAHAKVAWFGIQYVLAQQLSTQRQGKRRPLRQTFKALKPLLDDVADLIRRDRDNIARGAYRVASQPLAPVDMVAHAVRYFTDLRTVQSRRERNAFLDVRRTASVTANARPAYYLRNFHFQTDGYLSARSADLYDHQVEVLFLGAAGAMRRQALVPISAYLAARRRSASTLLDIATGTAPLLADLQCSFPALTVHGVDLSLPYLKRAKASAPAAGVATFTQAQGEMLPVGAETMDLVTCIYLLHELPAPVRAKVFCEAARVLRPGGCLILEDSIQLGDVPAYDPMIENFPTSFHEPFYLDYAKSDMSSLAGAAGLHHAGSTRAFLSKVMVFDKPAANAASPDGR